MTVFSNMRHCCGSTLVPLRWLLCGDDWISILLLKLELHLQAA
jgi:hypothetical protein